LLAYYSDTGVEVVAMQNIKFILMLTVFLVVTVIIHVKVGGEWDRFVHSFVCLFSYLFIYVQKLTQKVVDRFWWNF